MSIPSIIIRFAGMAALDAAFDQIIGAAGRENKGQWYVASAAEYAGILEWRTPHWRVAVQMLADEVTMSQPEQQEYLNAMVAGGSMTKKMVMTLKATIRRQIKLHGLVDTGNYIGSIAIGPSEGEAFINSEDQLIDPSTSVLV
jgi:hypothetical protein